MAQNHNDHCILSANNINWRIIYMYGSAHIECVDRDNPKRMCVFDLTKVRWEDYTEKALAHLAQRWPGRLGDSNDD